MIIIAGIMIGLVLGAMILSVGIAIGRRLGETEAIRLYQEDDDEHFENEIGGY